VLKVEGAEVQVLTLIYQCKLFNFRLAGPEANPYLTSILHAQKNTIYHAKLQTI
jgi:hypothetical protein